MGQERHPGLQLNDDMRQQRHEWSIQRVTRPLLYALLVAIMFGLLGNGPLSHAVEESPGSPLRMEYERFMRHRAPEKLRLTIQPSSGTVSVLLDSQYAKKIDIKDITPTPEHVISDGTALTFVFNAGSSAPMYVEFHIQPEKVGKMEGWIALKDNPRQPFSQFVYP